MERRREWEGKRRDRKAAVVVGRSEREREREGKKGKEGVGGRGRERERVRWCTCLYTLLYIFQLAEEHGVKFMETSAKSGLNVETVCHCYTCISVNHVRISSHSI